MKFLLQLFIYFPNFRSVKPEVLFYYFTHPIWDLCVYLTFRSPLTQMVFDDLIAWKYMKLYFSDSFIFHASSQPQIVILFLLSIGSGNFLYPSYREKVRSPKVYHEKPHFIHADTDAYSSKIYFQYIWGIVLMKCCLILLVVKLFFLLI